MRTCAVAAIWLAALWPATASAHAFAQRYDLPLPLWHYLAGAGAAVALSFLAALRVDAAGRFTRTITFATVPAKAARLARAVLRSLAVASLALLIAIGFLGPQGDWDSNLLPVTVWVLWWVGLSFLTMIVGPLWRMVDPWRALADAVAGRNRPALDRPARGGACWPGVVLFLAFCLAERVWTENAVPAKLATAVLGWSLMAWIGMVLVGREAWRLRCDPFDRALGLMARFAPLAWTRQEGATLVQLRWPGAGLIGSGGTATPSAVAFVLAMIATVSFDGLSETPLWEAITGDAVGALYAMGFVHRFGYGAAGSLVKASGLLAAPLVFATLFLAACALTGRIAGERTGAAARRFALSLVPIAVGYHVAHYFSYLLVQGQAAIPLLSDPFGLGWDLFGTRGREIDIGAVDMRTVWLVAVAAIVAGHASAVLVAHVEAVRAYGRRALASQLPLLLLMAGYTMLSLWILAQPIVNL